MRVRGRREGRDREEGGTEKERQIERERDREGRERRKRGERERERESAGKPELERQGVRLSARERLREISVFPCTLHAPPGVRREKQAGTADDCRS